MLNIPEEIIFFISNNFLNRQEIGRLLISNRKIKKIITKLYTGYIGNIIFYKVIGECINCNYNKSNISDIIYYLDMIKGKIPGFQNENKLELFKIFTNLIIYPCNDFNKINTKNIKIKNRYIIDLEFGLLLRIKISEIQNIKNILLTNNKVFRKLDRNIYSLTCIKNIKKRKKILLSKFRNVYSIIID